MRKNFLFALTAALVVTVVQPQMFLMAEEMEDTGYENEYETEEDNYEDSTEEEEDYEEEEPAVTELEKVKNVSVQANTLKSILISWDEVENAEGYEVQYSKKSNFSGASTITVDDAVETTIKKLNKNMKYYIRVRAYTETSEGELYGDYSKKTSVNIMASWKAAAKQKYIKYLTKKKSGFFAVKDMNGDGIDEMVYCKKMKSMAKMFTYDTKEKKMRQTVGMVYIDVDSKTSYYGYTDSMQEDGVDGLVTITSKGYKKESLKKNLNGKTVDEIVSVDYGGDGGVQYTRNGKKISASKFASLEKKMKAKMKNAGTYYKNNASNRKKQFK